MMLPYSAATMFVWVILFFAWYLLGIPVRPGVIDVDRVHTQSQLLKRSGCLE